MSDLVPAINDRVLSIIQFEHIDALSHLDALLETPGIDVFLWAPPIFTSRWDTAANSGTPRSRL